MEESMPLARLNTTSRSIGLFASVLGLGTLLASPADARAKYRQQYPAFTQWSYGTPGVYRNTPPGNVVCWTPCGHPGSIVMGADPDPFIRQQILRDASGFFGGGGR
jgi:hypothetical protein